MYVYNYIYASLFLAGGDVHLYMQAGKFYQKYPPKHSPHQWGTGLKPLMTSFQTSSLKRLTGSLLTSPWSDPSFFSRRIPCC